MEKTRKRRKARAREREREGVERDRERQRENEREAKEQIVATVQSLGKINLDVHRAHVETTHRQGPDQRTKCRS